MNIADFVLREVKKYRWSNEFRAIFVKYKDGVITEEIIRELLESLFKSMELRMSQDNSNGLKKKIADFVPVAIEEVLRNVHMHEARGESVFNKAWVDALLVAFANYSLLGIVDLAMYSTDLYT